MVLFANEALDEPGMARFSDVGFIRRSDKEKMPAEYAASGRASAEHVAPDRTTAGSPAPGGSTECRPRIGKATAESATGHHSEDFATFYAASFRAVTAQIYAYTGDLCLAQDLVQEAFCRALARWTKLSTYDDPVAWVRRVAFNLAKSRWQRTRISLRYVLSQRERHVEEPRPDRVVAVAALAKLPGNQRRALVLFYLADLPIADIAEQEGVAVGTVKSWLSRGRAALAGLLNDGEGRYV